MESDHIKSRWLSRFVISAVIILVPFVSGYLAYQSQSVKTVEQEPAQLVAGDQPALAQRPVTVTPGVHLLGGLAPAAAYVVPSCLHMLMATIVVAPSTCAA